MENAILFAISVLYVHSYMYTCRTKGLVGLRFLNKIILSYIFLPRHCVCDKISKTPYEV